MDILKAALPAVLVLVVLAVVLGVGSQVILKTQDTQGTTTTESTINESLSANGSIAHSGTPTISLNIHNTSAKVTNVSNDTGYTQVMEQGVHYGLLSDGTFTMFPQAAGVASGSWKVNISYNYSKFAQTYSWNASQDGLTGLDTFSEFQPSVAVVLVAVVVIGALLGGWAMMNGFNMKGGF